MLESSIGFIGREKPSPIDWPELNIELDITWKYEVGVTILRPILFFYESQKITLGKLREFFAPKGIKLLEKDGFIKLGIEF